MNFNLLAFSFQSVLGILLAIVLLLVMVTVHEFGHYSVGKALRFKIEEFSIGFGPKLFGRKKKDGELFSLRLIPLGGYCAFAGEEGDGKEFSEGDFRAQKPFKRILVLIAGPAMNYLLSLLLLLVLFFGVGQPTYRLVGVEEASAYPAQYSLAEGDSVLKIDGKNAFTISDYIYALDGKKQNELVPFVVLRNGKITEVSVLLRADVSAKSETDYQSVLAAISTFQKGERTESGDGGNLESGAGGLMPSYARLPFFRAIGGSFAYSGRLVSMLFSSLSGLFSGKLALTDLGGPITTIALTSEVASAGVGPFLTIAAYIGVNLAVFNLLPIPALDGSKVLFTLFEWIFHKPVPPKIEGVLSTVGFILLLGFAILVDILHFL